MGYTVYLNAISVFLFCKKLVKLYLSSKTSLNTFDVTVHFLLSYNLRGRLTYVLFFFRAKSSKLD